MAPKTPSELVMMVPTASKYDADDKFVTINELTTHESMESHDKVGLFVHVYSKRVAKDDNASSFQVKGKGGTNNVKPYNKIMFAMDPNGISGQNMALFLIGQNINQHMFDTCRLYRDSLGPGSAFTLDSPSPVGNYFGDKDDDTRKEPLITIPNSVNPVKLSITELNEVAMDTNSSHQHAFIYHECKVFITSYHMMAVKCPSTFCHAIGMYSHGGEKMPSECACFGNSGDVGMSFVFDVRIVTGNGLTILEHGMTSKDLTKFFMKNQTIPNSVNPQAFWDRRVSKDVGSVIKKMTEYINNGVLPADTEVEGNLEHQLPKKGFSILGWIRMGNVRDLGEVQDGFSRKPRANLNSSMIKPHITRIVPSGIEPDSPKLEKYRFPASSLLADPRGPVNSQSSNDAST